MTINLDDCLLIKDNIDDEGEEYISIPKPNDLNERSNESHKGEHYGLQNHENDLTGDQEVSLDDHIENDEIQVVTQDAQVTENNLNESSTATSETIDFGFPVVCKTCDKEFSSKVLIDHCKEAHDKKGTLRSLGQTIPPTKDSVYENGNNIQPGLALVNKVGQYHVLKQYLGNQLWQAENLNTKEIVNLHVFNDMPTMRVIGFLDDHDNENVFITTNGKKSTFAMDSFQQKLFFTSENQCETDSTFVVNIPRSRHREPECMKAKFNELENFVTFDVYDVVKAPENVNIIGTDWVLIEKENAKTKKTEVRARLVMRGDLELNKHMIAVDSPTVNRISLKLMLTLAASKGLQVQCNDIQRAFLQTVGIDRDVYVQAPPEAQLPNGKVWKLKRAVYGLVDASRAFFLRHAKGLNELGFRAVKYDNATFVKTNANGDTEMITSVHVDDTVNVASEEVLKKHHNQMKEKFKYGSSDDLPCRYLGMNMARNENGDIILDQDHYVANLEIPDISETQGVKRDEVINDKLQSVFRSIASKLNMLSLSSRPDFAIQAKMLTTKYGSATKRDLLTAIKLLKMAKEEPTRIIIPNLGNVSDWILVGISDASHKKDDNNLP